MFTVSWAMHFLYVVLGILLGLNVLRGIWNGVAAGGQTTSPLSA